MPRLSKRDRLFLNNPVLVQGLGLAPIVIAATTLKNAWILAVAVVLLLTPTRVIAAWVSRLPFLHFRGVTYSLVSSVVYIAVSWFMISVVGMSVSSIGLYLPLLVVEPIIIKRYERPQQEKTITAVKKGIFTTLGFLLALFLIAGIREMLAFGTIGGYELVKEGAMPLAALPGGGFIFVGVLAAIWRYFINAFKKTVNMGARMD